MDFTTNVIPNKGNFTEDNNIFRPPTTQFLPPIGKFESCLGFGSYSIVLQAVDLLGSPSAVKIQFQNVADIQQVHQINRECSIIKSLGKHLNVVNVLQAGKKVFTKEEFQNIVSIVREIKLPFGMLNSLQQLSCHDGVIGLCIQMECCGENLRSWLNNEHDIYDTNVQTVQLTITQNLISGVKYLHENRILHRDLKPANIMFSSRGYQLPVKIGDFGLSRILSFEKDKLTSVVGTYQYMAPEVRSGSEYGFKADLYSLGLIIWEVVQFVKRDFMERLVYDDDQSLVMVHPGQSGVSKIVIELSKRKVQERGDLILAELLLPKHTLLYGKKLVRTSFDLHYYLNESSSGCELVLESGTYFGSFVLKTDFTKISGVRSETILQSDEDHCLRIESRSCMISNICLVSKSGNYGVELTGSWNILQNIQFSSASGVNITGNNNKLRMLKVMSADSLNFVAKNGVSSVELGARSGFVIKLSQKSNHNELTNIMGPPHMHVENLGRCNFIHFHDVTDESSGGASQMELSSVFSIQKFPTCNVVQKLPIQMEQEPHSKNYEVLLKTLQRQKGERMDTICRTERKFDALLGYGAFGFVLRLNDPPQAPTAVKLMNKTGVNVFSAEMYPEIVEGQEKRIFREISVQDKLKKNENIVELINVVTVIFTEAELENIKCLIPFYYKLPFDVFASNEVICMQMELCGETLKSWLAKGHTIKDAKVQIKQLHIIRNITAGVKYLHENNIIHRDLKPDNIMFSKENFTLPVKIGDFGLCREVMHSKTGQLTSGIGSRNYMSPEIRMGLEYDLTSDIFSLGLIIWEVVQFVEPKYFERMVYDEMFDMVECHPLMNGIRELITKMTKRKVEERYKNLDEVTKLMDIWSGRVFQGYVHIHANNSEELTCCLSKIAFGCTIILGEGVFEGSFVVEQDNLLIIGQMGQTIVRCNNGTVFHLKSSDCRVRNIKFISDHPGVEVLISGNFNNFAYNNFVANVSLKVSGEHNIVENLLVSNTVVGILITGNQNKIQVVQLTNISGSGIEVHSNQNKLLKISANNVSIAVCICGSNNQVMETTCVKDSKEIRHIGVWLCSGKSSIVDRLTCTGYSSRNRDYGLKIDSTKSVVSNGMCGPVKVLGGHAKLTYLDCGERIEIVGYGTRIRHSRGDRLIAAGGTSVKGCTFKTMSGTRMTQSDGGPSSNKE